MGEGLFYRDQKTGKKMAKEFWLEGVSEEEISKLKKRIKKIIEDENLKPRFIKYGDLDQYDILLDRIISDHEGGLTFEAKKGQMIKKLNDLSNEMDMLGNEIDKLRKIDSNDSRIKDLRQKITEKRNTIIQLLNEKNWDESVADFN